MRISKTLFKNLMRCPNFASILDIYRNRAANSVKIIDGSTPKEIDECINTFSEELNIDDMFSEQNEKLLEIFNELFDEDTGEDLTNVTSAQLEAFADTFVEVERLAMEQAKRMFGNNIKASTNTFDQQLFSFSENDHYFYCYLDGYQEEDNVIRIFEVKSTTSKKYDDYQLKIRKKKNSDIKLPFFMMDNNHISKYIGDTYIGQKIDNYIITKEDVDKKKKNLLTPYSDVGKYIYDLAIESYIIKNSLIEKGIENIPNIEYYLVCLNAEYIYDGYQENGERVYRLDESGNELFKFYNLSNLVSELYDSVDNKKHNIFKYIDELTLSKNRLGEYCEYKKTTQCKFNKVCFSNVLKDGSILEYIKKKDAFFSPIIVDGKGKKSKLTLYDMINTKHYMITDCREYIDKIDNIVQYDCVSLNKEYRDLLRIRKAVDTIQYPIYHLDFESYNCPLPRFRGEKAFMQSLFQYSLHKESEPGVCDIVNNHTEYLAPDHNDHREDLIKSLIHDIDLSNGGCVMVYNQNFEKTRLKELAEIFPKYKKELDKINENVFDLLYVIKGNKDLFQSIMSEDEYELTKSQPSFTYYNNSLHGSFSIKKVLPIFTNLTYKTLEVKNGTEAIQTYGMLPTLTEDEYNKKYLALRVYCRQDTWAMVEILRGLRRVLK